MNTELVAKVLAKKNNGKRKIGTGYLINQELVLTARHIVVFEGRDFSTPVQIDLPDLGMTDIEATILFDGGKFDIDLVILKCIVPVKINSLSAQLAAPNASPQKGKQWDSYGYPRFGKNEEGKREKRPAMGYFFKQDINNPAVELSLEGNASNTEDWAGMSGAAVFQGSLLYAVITEVPKKVNDRFRAISIPWMLKNNTEFSEKIRDENDEKYQSYLSQQKQLINALLLENVKESLTAALLKKLGLNASEDAKERSLSTIMRCYEEDCLDFLDKLLQASADALKKDASEASLEFVNSLFSLFMSLTAPNSQFAKKGGIDLNVRTQIANEIHLAPQYNTTPDFEHNEGAVKGKCAINEDVFTRDIGWQEEESTQEARKIVYKLLYKKDFHKESFDDFDTAELNMAVKYGQNKSVNQLYRFELNTRNPEAYNHPLLDDDFCTALNSEDCMPDLPIVRYGHGIAENEAQLSALTRRLLSLLNEYGYSK